MPFRSFVHAFSSYACACVRAFVHLLFRSIVCILIVLLLVYLFVPLFPFVQLVSDLSVYCLLLHFFSRWPTMGNLLWHQNFLSKLTLQLLRNTS